MDYFKIIILIILILLSYKVFIIDKKVSESFESTSTSLVDDWNAINQLAQISKKLLTGGLTIPGNLNVSGSILVGGTDLKNQLNTLQSQINTLQSQINDYIKLNDKPAPIIQPVSQIGYFYTRIILHVEK